MNIFVLDKNPRVAAKYLHDVHLRKMIIESCQMLANCYSFKELKKAPKTQKGNVRKHSYYNHPCSISTRKSIQNFNWLLEHAIAISDEYKFRFEKTHYCIDFLKWCCNNKPNLENGSLDFYECVPNVYKCNNIVISYRNYYKHEKIVDKNGNKIDNYTKRNRPSWLPNKTHDININFDDLKNRLKVNMQYYYEPSASIIFSQVYPNIMINS